MNKLLIITFIFILLNNFIFSQNTENEKFAVNDTIFLLFTNYETGFCSEFKISILDYQHLQTEKQRKR